VPSRPATRICSIASSAPWKLVSAIPLLAIQCRVAGASVIAATPDCSASGDSFQCSLLGFLHFLYAAAGLLAIVLIVAVLVAVHVYRKNKHSSEDDH
jgi:hypothetical protein